MKAIVHPKIDISTVYLPSMDLSYKAFRSFTFCGLSLDHLYAQKMCVYMRRAGFELFMGSSLRVC